MIGNIYTITNQAGDFIKINDHTTDPDNFIALQDYPLFDVDVKNEEMNREGAHGIWDFNSYYGKRAINFTGVIIGETEADVETIKTQMLKVLALPPIPEDESAGYVTIKWEDANGDDWQIDAKIQSYPRFQRGMKQNLRLGFQISLKAKNPEIESQTLLSSSGVRGWETGDATLPIELPAVIGLVFDNKMSVSNGGTVQAHTITRLYGEDGGITNPKIYNITTNKLFKVNTTLADATEWIEINSKLGTVVDQDGNDLSGLVDSSSEYILLEIGTNEVVYLSDESEGAGSPLSTWEYPEATFSVSHRTTII